MSEWRFLSFVVFFLCLLVACSEFPEQTAHGYAFQYHRQLGGKPLEIGETAFVQFQIRTAGEVLFVSPNGAMGMRTVLQDPDLNPIKDPDPIADVLPLMGEGDSVTVMMPVSDDMRAAFALEYADEIFYDVVVRRIVRADEAIEHLESANSPEVDPEALRAQSQKVEETLAVNSYAKSALDELRTFVKNRAEETNRQDSLFYQIIDQGLSKEWQTGDRIKVHFIAAQEDGLLIGESFSTQPHTFTVGAKQVIKAWELAADWIGPGGKLLLEVPPAWAYGASGKAPYIGPEDTIYYYYEIVE